MRRGEMMREGREKEWNEVISVKGFVVLNFIV